MEKELAAELQFHCDEQAAKLMRAGVPRDEALRRARLSIGGVEQVKEECREARGVAMLESTAQDFHYGLRQLRRRPGFALVVVASLALGIGANTAIFSLIDAVLLRMLPIEDPAGLQLLVPRQANGDGRGFEYRGVPSHSRRERRVHRRRSLRIRADQCQRRWKRRTHIRWTAGLWQLLLAAGRPRRRRPDHRSRRRPEPERASGRGHQPRLLEAAVRSRTLGVGRTLHLSGRPFTIIGVAPKEFFGLEVGRAPDIWVPLMMQPTVMPAVENWIGGASISTNFWLSIVGRMKPGYGTEQVRGVSGRPRRARFR